MSEDASGFPASGASEDGPPPPSDEHVAQRAREIDAGGEDNSLVEDQSERAARQILQDSEERTLDPATVDPENDGVIRRTTDETVDPLEPGSPPAPA